MKQFNLSVLIILAVFTLSSCEQALDLLSDDNRDPFVGKWSVAEETTLKTNYTYFVNIEKSADDSVKVFIKNFYEIDQNASVEAVVNGSNINIPSQSVSGFGIQGYGTMAFSGKTIDWSYTVNYGNGSIDMVTATYTKQ
jgi:hypothetical protein